MKLQKDSYSCGVYAVMNAAKCLGVNLSRRDITKFSKTTREKGTSEKGILKALEKNNLIGEEFVFGWKTNAIKFVNEIIGSGNPIILSVDNDNHWCTLIGTIGDKYILSDSENSKANKEQNGIYLLSENDLLNRWKNEDSKYYCIVVDVKI